MRPIMWLGGPELEHLLRLAITRPLDQVLVRLIYGLSRVGT